MNKNATPEDRIAAWLASDAPTQAPGRLLEKTFEGTRRFRRRWPPLDWSVFPMRNAAMFATAAAIVVAVVILAGGFLGRSPGVGAPATTSPSASPSGSIPSSDTASVEPDLATATGQVAYHATVDGNTDIYVANGDGTGVVRLTTDPSPDLYPSWSPEGESIAFVRDGDVHVMAADGSAATRVASSWEPGAGQAAPDSAVVVSYIANGTKLMFGRPYGEENWAIYEVELDGSNERLVYEEPTHLEARAQLIGDDVLLVVRDLILGGGLEIARVDLTTGIATPLTDYRDGEESNFAVSPDGSRIAYQSEGPQPGLLVMNADGTNSRRITAEYSAGPIAWTADGSTLSFGAGGWVNLVRLDGTGLTRLLPGDYPAWRPGT